VHSITKILLLLAVSLLLANCNFSPEPQGGATPTLEAEAFVPTVTSEATLTLAPSMTVELLQVETPTSTPTTAPPTETLLPTFTLGPYEHTIVVGDSLITIIQEYSYTDFSTSPGSIIDEIVRLNENVPNADILPGPGSIILVPRQTATMTPASTEAAAIMQATNTASAPNVQFSDNTTLTEYIVQEGDTIISIAQEFNRTLEQIAVLNPELNVFGCNFEIPSGGPNCNIPLQIGQVLKLPAPTPTPTLSPTPSGSETSTPTPTYMPPMMVYPPQGANAAPGVFSLQWVGVGVLQANEYYLVEVVDLTSGAASYRQVTKNTSLLLPDSLIPTDGQTHTFNWTVRVATPNEQGVYRTISGEPEIRSFQWQSR
jgi:hypothetical protein